MFRSYSRRLRQGISSVRWSTLNFAPSLFRPKVASVQWIGYIATALAAYLLGSVPTGYLVGRARGVDIRTVGSGNIGATNVFRALGRAAGILVLVVDAAKGYAACAVLAPLLAGLTSAGVAEGTAAADAFRILAGISVILGHNYSCWLRFKGGKGVATTAGVLLAWFPMAFAIALAVWLVVFLLSRIVSLASIVAAVALPVSVGCSGGGLRWVVVSALLGLLAIYTHRSNIRRLLDGTEHRFGRKTPSDNTP